MRHCLLLGHDSTTTANDVATMTNATVNANRNIFAPIV